MAVFSENQEKMPNERVIPEHIAIIMDGNGRWAKKRGLARTMGHAAGTKVFRTIATYCRDIGVKHLTVYAFSTENWKRTQDEVDTLMRIFKQQLQEALESFAKEKFRLHFAGDLSRLSPELQTLARKAEKESAQYEDVQLHICLNYGGRDEILRAVRAFGEKCAAGEYRPSDLTEEAFSALLDFPNITDPDLIIRPSGEYRLSNFLLWQSAYSEFYFTDVLWPDFTPQELDRAIEAYGKRNRRYGGVKP